MSLHYPKLRLRAESGLLVIRDSVSLCFYMRCPSKEVVAGVMSSLDAYVRAVGPRGLDIYADDEGEWQPMDDAGWEQKRRELLTGYYLAAHLRASENEERFRFDYHGKPPRGSSLWDRHPDAVSAVRFVLPTEYLEEHGPERVRALALELAEPLPLCSGHVGLSWNAELDLVGVSDELRKFCFRYPGMNLIDLSSIGLNIGTRVYGATWMTFLGPPVLGELGGVDGLRSRLREPGTTVQALGAERAVVTLGEWPEAGDTENGLLLPAYRELARVLGPWQYRHPGRFRGFSDEDMRRWDDRFRE